jgi:cytochrome c-type biogenesis protein CcmE
VLAGKAPKLQAFRIGGLVKEGSLKRDNLTVHFVFAPWATTAAVRIALE